MKVFHATKELRSPTELNGKLGKSGLRFAVMFEPGEDKEISDAEFAALEKEEVFQFLIEKGILKEIAEKSKKTPLEKAQENLVKAEESQNAAKSDEEKKAASENLKSAKAELKKLEKKAK